MFSCNIFLYFSTSILCFGLIRCPRLHSTTSLYSENGVFFKVNTVFYNTRLATSWQRWSHLTMKSFHTLQLRQYYASCQAAVIFLRDSLGAMRSFVPPSPTGQWYARALDMVDWCAFTYHWLLCSFPHRSPCSCAESRGSIFLWQCLDGLI